MLVYEDLNDHGKLRSDLLFAQLAGKHALDVAQAVKSMLNRLELSGRISGYQKIDYSADALDRLLVGVIWSRHAAVPNQIVLDLEATEVPFYGHQPERFFHGYYDSYCYLQL